MDYGNEETKSKFNAGLAKLERIGELRKGIHDARISRDWEKYKACLEGIRSEINSKLNKTQKDKCSEHENFITYTFEEFYNAIRRKLSTSANPRRALYNYELYIGELEEHTGMGMPEDDDDGL